MNFNIKLNLTGLKNSGIVNLEGKTGKKRCIVIPVEDNEIFEGKQGAYLSLSVVEMQNPRYEETHIVKHSLSKEAYQALSEEQKREIPIIGGMRPFVAQQNAAPAQNANVSQESIDDLPF